MDVSSLITFFSYGFVALVFDTLVLCYLSYRCRRFFWGKLLIVSLSLSIAMALYNVILMDLLKLNDFYFKFQPILSIFGRASFILSTLAFAALPWSHSNPDPSPFREDEVEGGPLAYRKRHPALTMLWMLITLNLYWVIWLYRSVKELRQLGPFPFSPGRAVGFLFIPVFNLGWLIYVLIRLGTGIKALRARLPCKPHEGYSVALLPTFCLAGMVLNSFTGLLIKGNNLDTGELIGMAVKNELVFLFAFFYTQRYIREIWRSVEQVLHRGTG